jgi:hypothetical protein
MLVKSITRLLSEVGGVSGAKAFEENSAARIPTLTTDMANS